MFDPQGSFGSLTGGGPHSDSRGLAWDFQTGDLLLACDGGVYKRTAPQTNTGDWFSINGNLAVSEFISAAYHLASDILVVGAQDNQGALSYPPHNVVTDRGTGYSSKLFASGDGGFTHVDNSHSFPRFYMTAQNLGGYGYTTPATIASQLGTEAQNTMITTTLPASLSTNPQPMQPFTGVNAVNSARTLVCTSAPDTACYDVVYQTETTNMAVTKIASAYYEAYAYGGTTGGVADADVVFAVSGTGYFTRNKNNLPNGLTTTTGITWSAGCFSVSMHPTNYQEVMFTCGLDVYLYTGTFQAAGTITLVTGNLATAMPFAVNPQLYATCIVPLSSGTAYLIGTWRGVYATFALSANSAWVCRFLNMAVAHPSSDIVEHGH